MGTAPCVAPAGLTVAEVSDDDDVASLGSEKWRTTPGSAADAESISASSSVTAMSGGGGGGNCGCACTVGGGTDTGPAA